MCCGKTCCTQDAAQVEAHHSLNRNRWKVIFRTSFLDSVDGYVQQFENHKPSHAKSWRLHGRLPSSWKRKAWCMSASSRVKVAVAVVHRSPAAAKTAWGTMCCLGCSSFLTDPGVTILGCWCSADAGSYVKTYTHAGK